MHIVLLLNCWDFYGEVGAVLINLGNYFEMNCFPLHVVGFNVYFLGSHKSTDLSGLCCLIPSFQEEEHRMEHY